MYKSGLQLDIKIKNGEEKVKITVYAVPIKNQFYQITFMDSENEDKLNYIINRQKQLLYINIIA